jgi:hypothetical protein
MRTEDWIARQLDLADFLESEATLSGLDGCDTTAKLLRQTAASLRRDIRARQLIESAVCKLQGEGE